MSKVEITDGREYALAHLGQESRILRPKDKWKKTKIVTVRILALSKCFALLQTGNYRESIDYAEIKPVGEG